MGRGFGKRGYRSDASVGATHASPLQMCSAVIQSELFALLQALGAKPEDRVEVGYDALMYQKNISAA